MCLEAAWKLSRSLRTSPALAPATVAAAAIPARAAAATARGGDRARWNKRAAGWVHVRAVRLCAARGAGQPKTGSADRWGGARGGEDASVTHGGWECPQCSTGIASYIASEPHTCSHARTRAGPLCGVLGSDAPSPRIHTTLRSPEDAAVFARAVLEAAPVRGGGRGAEGTGGVGTHHTAVTGCGAT
jgi:hypothetical protein